MRFSHISSAQNHLLKAHVISVETDISRGLHTFSIVGLPDKAVEEARDRVSAAIKNSGFKSPKQTNAKIVVSLAPADIKKEGPAFDLPIALGYLLAAGEISFETDKRMFVGELALDGAVRPVNGALSFARLARDQGFRELYVPRENAAEAALISNVDIYAVSSLSDVIGHLDMWQGERLALESASVRPPGRKLVPEPLTDYRAEIDRAQSEWGASALDLDDVVGQETAKRGLIIAAAGRHNIALFGPPGTGKTMLARALLSIMPSLSFEEMLEVTEIHSVAGARRTGESSGSPIMLRPPVRTPHHTASYSSLVGGGPIPKPGEITLAHRGILFLDEFPEFDGRVIEALRQPLESKTISIARASGTATFPADFIMVAALNPCPCGNRGIRGKQCTCTPVQVRNYEKRVSGPIIDRIDMWIEVSRVDHDKLMRERRGGVETARARRLVLRARSAQRHRFAKLGIAASANASISARDLSKVALLSTDAEEMLNRAALAYDLSGRGYHRVVKLARTIADLAESQNIEAPHILEALQYRQKRFDAG